MAKAMPGGTISARAGRRLAARMNELRDANMPRGGMNHRDADGDYDGDMSHDTESHGGYGIAQQPWPATNATRGTHNATPSRMAPFGENTQDEGRGRARGRLPDDQINDQRFQRMGPPPSRGAGVSRPRVTNTGDDHINNRGYGREWPEGTGSQRRRQAGSRVSGPVAPSGPPYGGVRADFEPRGARGSAARHERSGGRSERSEGREERRDRERHERRGERDRRGRERRRERERRGDGDHEYR